MTPGVDSLTLARAKRAAGGGGRRRRRARELPRDATTSAAGSVVGQPVRHPCEVCGELARVHVLEGYVRGQPILRRFCLRCAPDASLSHAGQGLQGTRLRLYVLVGLAGLGLGAVALLGDWLIPSRVTAGFGWHKEFGLAVGALLVLVGAVSRADIVTLGGVFVFGGSLVAGWFGLTHSPGIGWKEYTLLGLAFGCLVLAVLGRLGLAAYVRRAVRALRSALCSNNSQVGG